MVGFTNDVSYFTSSCFFICFNSSFHPGDHSEPIPLSLLQVLIVRRLQCVMRISVLSHIFVYLKALAMSVCAQKVLMVNNANIRNLHLVLEISALNQVSIILVARTLIVISILCKRSCQNDNNLLFSEGTYFLKNNIFPKAIYLL